MVPAAKPPYTIILLTKIYMTQGRIIMFLLTKHGFLTRPDRAYRDV